VSIPLRQRGLADPFQLAIILDLRRRLAEAEAAVAAASSQDRGEAERQVHLWRWAYDDATTQALQVCVDA
jgi:hypothetical protein